MAGRRRQTHVGRGSGASALIAGCMAKYGTLDKATPWFQMQLSNRSHASTMMVLHSLQVPIAKSSRVSFVDRQPSKDARKRVGWIEIPPPKSPRLTITHNMVSVAVPRCGLDIIARPAFPRTGFTPFGPAPTAAPWTWSHGRAPAATNWQSYSAPLPGLTTGSSRMVM